MKKSLLMPINDLLRENKRDFFKILGGITCDKICDYFEGEDKIICGSHFANDDLYITVDSSMVEK